MTIRTGGLTLAAMLVFSGLAVGQGAPGRFQRPAPPPLPPAVASGKAIFAQNCSFCHGADAEGQSGPDLTSSPVVAADVNGNAIGQVVLNGRPGTAMPAFKFTPAQIQNIAAFLHFQTYAAMKQKGGRKGVVPADLQTGNAAAGKAFFNGAGGCSACHSPTGDLAGVATRLQGLGLEMSFLSVPRDTVSLGPPPVGRGGSGRGGRGGPPPAGAIAKVTVTLPSGQTFQGDLVYQDDFTIAMVDAAGYYHSWPKSQVKSDVNAPGEAHAALLSKYTDADIHNLMAYLQTLTGPAQPEPAPSDPPAPSAAVLALNPGVTTSVLLHPPTSSWPTYHGDYSGRRHSSLTQINSSNVNQLGVAWKFAATGRISASPLVVDGVLYISVPNNIWAVDARTGHMIWHYTAPPNEGSTIGNRGVAMYKNWLYFEIPDGHLVSLNAKDGSLRWIKEIVDYHLGYWTSTSPLVIGDHVIVGASGDFDNVQSLLRAVDPVTGDTQWDWHATPPAGTPNTATGGNTWMTGTYDPTLNLLYWGTGNPTPVLEGKTRPGNNLYTCSIVAINPDTGKLVWGFQASPHDTHDWDAAEVPVLVDGTFNGQPRKMLMQASRNGYFFVLDRTNGKSLLTTPFGPVNWASGVAKDGSPIPNPEKEPTPDGRLLAPAEGGLANYRSPSFDPQTGLFVVNSTPSYGIYFNKPADGTFGWAGGDYGVFGSGVLEALDYQTGQPRWKHAWPGGSSSGVLTTDSGLTFVTDSSGNFIALNTSDGKILWHSAVGTGSSASPMTYDLDGRQYVVSSFGSDVVAWALSN